MPSFFTSGFAKRRAGSQGRNLRPDETEDTATTKRAGKVAEDTRLTPLNRENHPLCTMHEGRRDRYSGDIMHHTMPGAMTGFGYLLTPSSVHIAQPPPIPGYPPFVATPGGMYAIAPQPSAFVPPLAHVIMPVVSLSNLVEWKMTDMGGGNADKKGSEKPVREKKSGKYYVWEQFYDEEGKRIWIHMDTGKRTREDPYCLVFKLQTEARVTEDLGPFSGLGFVHPNLRRRTTPERVKKMMFLRTNPDLISEVKKLGELMENTSQGQEKAKAKVVEAQAADSGKDVVIKVDE